MTHLNGRVIVSMNDIIIGMVDKGSFGFQYYRI